jgi:hypothetical protein
MTFITWPTAFIWHNGLSLAQRPFSGTMAFLWHSSLSLAQRPFSGTTAFLWHNGLCLSQQPLPCPRLLLDPIGTVAFIWRNGLHLAQRPSSCSKAFVISSIFLSTIASVNTTTHVYNFVNVALTS